MRYIKSLLLFIALAYVDLHAQNKFVIYGTVSNENGDPLELVSIVVENSMRGTTSDSNGNYELELPQKDSIVILFSRIGVEKKSVTVAYPDKNIPLDMILKVTSQQMLEIEVTENRYESITMDKLDPKLGQNLPDASGNAIESLVMTLPGVRTNNELSSQYSVRGGNFDENLVYVNDIEVYRPFLIRSGQQEGLSFINSKMVANVGFSAGGYDARYGDKMSSVLDIHYRRPQYFSASASVSLLGASVHLETASKNKKFTQIHGLRYKSNQYLLGTLDTKGEYRPSFFDYQTYLTYKINSKLDIGFLGNVSQNVYQFRPQTRSTSFGTWNIARQLNVYFDGWENDKFLTGMGALTLNYLASKKSTIKLITSAFVTNEQENFDITGEYWLNELDTRIGTGTTGDSIANIGVGGYHQHARNRLQANVISAELKGLHDLGVNLIRWGVKIQNEDIDDEINEWEYRDSAGYSVPYSNSEVLLFDAHHANIHLSTQRVNMYVQDSYALKTTKGNLNVTAGLRYAYWTFNNESLFSPRASVEFIPEWKSKVHLRAAAGTYYQAPFYKELRDPSGIVNTEIKSQKSMHYVGGLDYYFKKWERPFKFSAEVYYKQMSDLIPYDIDNVRIDYYGKNMAEGYAKGIDMRFYGEFVPGVDSWISLSLLDTKEKVHYPDFTTDWVSRPTDQSYNISMFFQDYFPGNPDYQLYLLAHVGGRLPTGPPNGNKSQMVFSFPPYYRVDMGMTRKISGEVRQNFLKHFKSIYIGAEVLNLLNINNVNSYFWIKDVYNQTYAVPNYLTGRRLNIKLTANF